MEQTIEVRKAIVKDLERIYPFVCHLEATTFPYDRFEEIYLENISHPDYVYLVAVNAADEAIGFLSCHGQNLLHHAGRVFEIQEIYVARNHRASGVGKQLIRALEDRLLKTGYKSFEVTANLAHTEAKKFFSATGFAATQVKLVKN